MNGIIERPENLEAISGLRIDIFDVPGRPSETLDPYRPKNALRYAWIPRTMGDDILVLFEFPSVAEREAWEATLPEVIRKWIDRRVIPTALEHGWSVRDWNGFPVG